MDRKEAGYGLIVFGVTLLVGAFIADSFTIYGQPVVVGGMAVALIAELAGIIFFFALFLIS